MNTHENKTLTFEVPSLEQQKVLVLDNCKFPYYKSEFISPNLVIAIVSNGESIGFYDKKPVHIKQHDVSMVLPNHICMEQKTSQDYKVTLVIISPGFWDEIVKTTVHRNYLKYHYSPISSLTEEQCRSLLRVAQALQDVSSLQNLSNRHEMLLNLSDVFLTLMSYYSMEHDSQSAWVSRGQELYNRFCDLLVKHYRESREVTFYAEKLHITPKHLSKMIHQTTGQSAMYWIEQHIAVQAQQLLRNRHDMSVMEIAYFLGFEQLAHFSRYFKRCTGLSPRQYREQTEQDQIIYSSSEK